MGCQEDFLDFREEVEKVTKARKRGPKDAEAEVSSTKDDLSKEGLYWPRST